MKYIPIILLLLIHFSTQLSSQWIHCNGPYGGSVKALANDGYSVFAGTSNGGFYLTTDDGQNWIQRNNGLNTLSLNSILIFNNKIYTGTLNSGIFRSADYGLNWIQRNNGISNLQIQGFTFLNNSIYAASYGGGVYRSTNEGENWVSVNQGITSLFIRTIMTHQNILFAGTEGGIFKSTDGGTSWIIINNGLFGSLSTFSLGYSGNSIFASTYNNGIFRSVDQGGTWSIIYNGIPVNSTFLNFITSGEYIFAGANDIGVYLSLDGGSSWNPENAGLPSATTITSFTIKGENIFTGTGGYGVYIRPLSQLIAVKPISQNIPENFKLYQNYPNPFNPVTKIRFNIGISTSGDDKVSLVIYNSSGQLIASLFNETELKPGEYETEFDAGNQPSGVYFYNLKISNSMKVKYNEAKRMILLK